MLTFKLIAILGAIFFLFYRKLKNIYTIWERKGIKGPNPLWLVGNVMPLIRRKDTLNSFTHKLCVMHPTEKAVGIYFGVTPTLIVKDLNLVKKVLVKDYASFADRGLRPTHESVFDSIVFEKGEKWKVYRQKMHPLFSTGRMKNMFPNVAENIDQFLNYIDNLPLGPKELRTLDHKLGVKLVMSSLFGLTADIFNKEFGDDKIKEYDIAQVESLSLGAILYGINPRLPSAIGLKFIREKVLNMITNKSIMARKDDPHRDETFFDFMVKLKEKGSVKKEKKEGIVEVEISDKALTGNITIFYSAGFELFSNSSHLLFEISQNQEIQERCYKEIVEVMKKYNGDLTFEAINELQYVNMAFDESLRKYPSGGSLLRVATKDYHFEDIDLTIEKGTGVIIPVFALHYDPKLFPNPDVFDPERFSPENKKMIQDCSYLPFGDGPRKCIAFRLARFQNILLIARFLHKFKVTPCEKTVPKIQFVAGRLSVYPQNGLWVNITKRQ